MASQPFRHTGEAWRDWYHSFPRRCGGAVNVDQSHQYFPPVSPWLPPPEEDDDEEEDFAFAVRTTREVI